MKSAILVESKKPLVVTDIDLPSELEFGQVLVKICYSGICGAQINEIDAIKGPDKYLPHLLGHEGSGIVEKVGKGVTRIKKGDHVVLHWRKSSGIQSTPASYLWKGKKLNAGWVTTFSEKSIVSENRLTVIPRDFDLKVAALFGCAVTSGFGAVNNDAKVKIGQSVLIFGIGGMGLNSFNLDFSDAPDFADVETGAGGLPSTPFTPNLTSPGPGSMNASDMPAYEGTFPGETTSDFGVGLGGTVSPSKTSKEIAKQTVLSDYILGRSFPTSNG